MDDKRFRSDRGRDPIEIARLIAQADTHEESASSDSRFREETVSDGYDETAELPPAPQLAVDLNEQEQACKRDEHCSGAQACDVDDQLYAAEEEYQDSEVPPYAAEEHYQDNEISHVRRHSRTLVMAIFGLALVGSAYAVGYRNMFGGSGSPTLPPTIKAINERNRIASVSEPQPASSGNAREISPATTGSIDSMVSREEQPATIGLPKAASRASLPRASAPAPSAAGQAVANQAVPRSAVAAEPPAPRFAVAASPERPGQSNGAHVTAASDHEHLDAGGYAVQVTSERSESRAQAAFRQLQVKYPDQLSGHQPIIRRADLGAAGIYYRALVGPFASAEKAAKMCSGMKAAGGDCIIQKN